MAGLILASWLSSQWVEWDSLFSLPKASAGTQAQFEVESGLVVCRPLVSPGCKVRPICSFTSYRTRWLRISMKTGSIWKRGPNVLVSSVPSKSYRAWLSKRATALNEIEAAHRSVGGAGPGRRYATQQINQAYAVLVASQFQGFCRDLHTESIARLMAFTNPPPSIRHLIQAGFTRGRQLDSKNAQPGSLGADFGLLGIKLWEEADGHDPKNKALKGRTRRFESVEKRHCTSKLRRSECRSRT